MFICAHPIADCGCRRPTRRPGEGYLHEAAQYQATALSVGRAVPLAPPSRYRLAHSARGGTGAGARPPPKPYTGPLPKHNGTSVAVVGDGDAWPNWTRGGHEPSF